MLNKIYLIFILFLFVQCSNSNEQTQSDNDYTSTSSNFSNDNFNSEDENSDEEAYPDGTYSAEVDYYNPDTGTSSTYTLDVEVENGELTVIHWPNGGWLDSSHFTPQDITSGSCSFISDEGYHYSIELLENNVGGKSKKSNFNGSMEGDMKGDIDGYIEGDL